VLPFPPVVPLEITMPLALVYRLLRRHELSML
jgi:hypothetical protein